MADLDDYMAEAMKRVLGGIDTPRNRLYALLDFDSVVTAPIDTYTPEPSGVAGEWSHGLDCVDAEGWVHFGER